MTRKTKDLVLESLARLKGDDAARARATFKNKTEKQMAEQYGESGQTCGQILAAYEEKEKEIDDAIREIKRASLTPV